MFYFLTLIEDEQERQKIADIYEEYQYICYRVAFKITNNKSMAEDAVQNAFLSIIKKKDEILKLNGRDLRAKIVIIVKNKAIDLMRSKHNSDISYDEADKWVKSDNFVEEQVIKNIEYERLKNHISELDEISRQVLQMKYVLGMSYKEIGEELGMTPKHVDTRIMRAKEKVRKLMEKEGCEI